jgi:uncharacterized protein (DUF2062 family)
LFGRRTKSTPLQRLGRALWPSRGFMRPVRYTWHRVARQNDSAHRIALGLAFGVFMSFSPLIGIHVLGAALLAWIFGANLLASAAGTLIGNPALFPLIWVWIYKSGKFILGETHISHAPAPFELSMFWHRPIEALRPILLPTMIGGVISGLVAGAIAYGLARAAVLGYQARRRQRMERARRARLAPGADSPTRIEHERKRVSH